MDLLPYPRRTDRESIEADARHVVGMTPEERAEVFVGLERTMEAILAHLSPDERRRRLLVCAPLVDQTLVAAVEAARCANDGQVLVLCPTTDAVVAVGAAAVVAVVVAVVAAAVEKPSAS